MFVSYIPHIVCVLIAAAAISLSIVSYKRLQRELNREQNIGETFSKSITRLAGNLASIEPVADIQTAPPYADYRLPKRRLPSQVYHAGITATNEPSPFQVGYWPYRTTLTSPNNNGLDFGSTFVPKSQATLSFQLQILRERGEAISRSNRSINSYANIEKLLKEVSRQLERPEARLAGIPPTSSFVTFKSFSVQESPVSNEEPWTNQPITKLREINGVEQTENRYDNT